MRHGESQRPAPRFGVCVNPPRRESGHQEQRPPNNVDPFTRLDRNPNGFSGHIIRIRHQVTADRPRQSFFDRHNLARDPAKPSTPSPDTKEANRLLNGVGDLLLVFLDEGPSQESDVSRFRRLTDSDRRILKRRWSHETSGIVRESVGFDGNSEGVFGKDAVTIKVLKDRNSKSAFVLNRELVSRDRVVNSNDLSCCAAIDFWKSRSRCEYCDIEIGILPLQSCNPQCQYCDE